MCVLHHLQVDVLLIPHMRDPYTDQVYDPLPPVERGEKVLLIIGTMSTFGVVKEVSKVNGRKATIVVTGLTPPTCSRFHESILVCRFLTLTWHLIGRGTIVGGRALEMASPPPAAGSYLN